MATRARILLASAALLAGCSAPATTEPVLKPAAPDSELSRLITSLGAESVEDRELARAGLVQRMRDAMPLLRTAAVSHQDPQVRREAGLLTSQFSTGSIVWTFRCPHRVENDRAPILYLGHDSERVYIECGCWETSLVALDIKTGALVWEWEPEDGGNEHYTLCLDQGLILGLFHEAYKPDRLVAIDARRGKTLWLKKGNLSFHWPVVLGGRAHVGGSEGVKVFDLKTGNELWKGPISSWTTSPRVTSEWVLAGADDGAIRAYGFDKGDLRWTFDTLEGRVSPLETSDGRVFGGSKNRLYALDLKTGARLWDIETTGWSHDGPRLIGGVLVYKTNYMGPEDKVNGGWPTLTRWIGVEPATGALVFEREERPLSVAQGHLWLMADEVASALNTRSLAPLKNGSRCGVEGCTGVHRLPARTLSIEGEEIDLFAEPDGRLRSGWVGSPRGSLLFETLGSFPVYSGHHYDGPRNSRLACIRAVDIDKE